MNNFNESRNTLENIGNKLSYFAEIPENGKAYTILGKGNFGYAEKMMSTINKNIYAIKKINKNSANFNQKNFKRETEIAIDLNHENLIKLYGYFEDKEKISKYKEIYKDKKKKENLDNITQDVEIYCLVLEYAEKGSLEDYNKEFRKKNPEQHIDQNFIIQIFKQLLNGLEYLKKKSVIHRDIKPDNILLDSKYNVKISDFGISALYKRTLSLEKNNIDPDLFMNYTLVGRQDFICPEIERREHYYFEADIFCLGLTLLVLMSKENPIINNKFFRIINDENMFEYNSYLKKLILKMLNKKYFLRPNASEALHELKLIEKYINEPNNNDVKLSLEEIKNKYDEKVQKYEFMNYSNNQKNMNNNYNNNINNNNFYNSKNNNQKSNNLNNKMNNPMINNNLNNHINNPMINNMNNHINNPMINSINNHFNNPMINNMNNKLNNNNNNPMINKMNNKLNNNMNNPMINKMNNKLNNNMNNPMINKMNNNLNNNMNNPMINKMNKKLNNNIYNPMINKMNKKLNNNIYNPMINNINNKIYNKMNNPMINNINNTMNNQTNSLMIDNMINIMNNNLNNIMKNNIKNQMNNNVNNNMNNLMINKMNNPMFNNMNNKMNNQINNSMINNMNNPMINQINKSMINQINNSMINNINNPIINKMNNPIINKMNNPMMNKMNNQMINNMNYPMINKMNNPMINNVNIQ